MGQDQGQEPGDAGRKMSCSSGTDEEQLGEGQEQFVNSNKEHHTIDVNAVLSSSKMIEQTVNENNISVSVNSGKFLIYYS